MVYALKKILLTGKPGGPAGPVSPAGPGGPRAPCNKIANTTQIMSQFLSVTKGIDLLEILVA